MKSKLLAGAAILSLAFTALAVSEPAIIPQPQKMERQPGTFKLSPDTQIYTDSAAAETGQLLAGKLRQATGWPFPVNDHAAPDAKITDGILLTTSGAKAMNWSPPPAASSSVPPRRRGCFTAR